MSGSKRIRIALGVAFTGALTVVLAHGLAWAYVTDRLRTQYLAGLDGLRQQGWQVAFEQPRRTGWPMAAVLQLGPLALNGGPAGVPLAWSASGTELGFHIRHPAILRIVPTGLQRIRLGSAPEFTLTAAAMDIQADGDTLHVTGQDLVLALPGGEARIGAMQARTNGLVLQAALAMVQLSDPRLPPLQRVTLDATLTQPVPAAADPIRQATRWRDQGGVVEVRAFGAQAGELAIQASGTVRLNAALQPVLEGTAILRGYRPSLDAMVQAGAIPASTALAVNAVLGLLSRHGSQAGATVPVRIADGVLSLAGFPLARLPVLEWPASGR